jgi:putative membrane protein
MINWWDWHHEPLVVGGLVVLGWAYAVATGPLRGRIAPGEPHRRGLALRFYSGLAIFFALAASPLDQVASTFVFTAHMIQQLAIMYAVAGLLLTGLPGWLADAALGWAPLRRPLRLLLHPVICGGLFIVIASAWQAPRMLESGLEDPFVRAIEQLTFLAAGALFWWPLLSPSRRFPAISIGGRLLYLLCTEVALTAAFSYLLMADHPVYPTYEYARRLFSRLDPVNDQYLAGALLSGVSSVVMVVAMGANFFLWARKDASPARATGGRAPGQRPGLQR